MVTFRTEYMKHLKGTGIEYVSPDFDEACLDCSINGSYSSAWTMQAAATVLARDIISVYPSVNGVLDKCLPILNTTFRPRKAALPRPRLYIMWSSLGFVGAAGSWTPNHFVPLLLRDIPESINLNSDISSNLERSDPCFIAPKKRSYAEVVSPKPFASINQAEREMRLSSPISPSSPDLQANMESPCPGSLSPPSIRTSTPNSKSRTQRTKKRALLPPSPPSHGNISESLDDDILSDPSDPTSTQQKPPTYPDFIKLPTSGKFMTVDRIFQQLTADHPIHKTIPDGLKNNVFFIVDNTVNNEKRRRNIRCDFPDDCGVWDGNKESTVNSFFIRDTNGVMKSIYHVYLKKENYCIERRIKGKSQWVPLDPQPVPEEVIKMHRYYATLKTNGTYRKRVTYLDHIPKQEYGNIAIVEYCDEYKNSVPPVHGNSKRNIPYVRTHPEVMENTWIWLYVEPVYGCTLNLFLRKH